MEAVERPHTSRGIRSRARRPPSRGGRQIEQLLNDEGEENGRPASRRGFTPETYDREDYDEFSRQSHVFERQLTPEYGSPPGIMSGHMSPYQQRNSPAFRDSPHSHRGYRPHRDSPLIHSPTHQESPHNTPFERPSSRRKGDVPDTGRQYSISPTHHEDFHYGSSPTERHHVSSPTERHYGSSPNHGHPDHRYGGQHIYDNNQQADFEHRANSPMMETNVLCLDDSWPPSPREKPPTARPKSSRKRLKSGRKKRHEQESHQTYSAVDTPILRPPSSLSKYKPLPAIGATSPTTDDVENISKKTQSVTLGLGERTRTSYSIDLSKKEDPTENGTSGESARRDSVDQRKSGRRESFEQITDSRRQSFEQPDSNRKLLDLSNKDGFKPRDLPTEPGETEQRILLAIRLPDGRRHQRYFRLVEKMDTVLKFAENVTGMELGEYRLACNAPKAVFTDLTQLIGESGLQDRTVLYLEELE
ncbi:uncharacterized protein LOC133205696 [Saccostrea echinata]|uniref:uncharacterized protein LOC133205696 n=1 Tax=Saccostrea echinata TaxID=191078 RepID=UPI002A808794|nr:uncharacterized protein LOC133205696 [Saccostrea echinata]